MRIGELIVVFEPSPNVQSMLLYTPVDVFAKIIGVLTQMESTTVKLAFGNAGMVTTTFFIQLPFATKVKVYVPGAKLMLGFASVENVGPPLTLHA